MSSMAKLGVKVCVTVIICGLLFHGVARAQTYEFVSKWGGQGGGGGLFNYPTGIAIDVDGNVYVADTLNNRIQKFDPNGNFVTMWGKQGYGDGEFYSPLGVAVDSAGFIYVAGGNSAYIQKFDSDGNFVLKWGTGGEGDGQFRSPSGIAVDDETGHVYVTDTGNHRVQKFDLYGNYVGQWGSEGSGDGEFTSPSGIAVKNGLVYVIELVRYDEGYGNRRVQKFDTDGTYLTQWPLDDVCCRWWPILMGIGVDNAGNIIVSDPYNSTIKKYDPSGTFISQLNILGSEDDEVKNPNGVAIDAEGNIYVADKGNYRIQKFDTDFSFLSKWGSFGGSGDGKFNLPTDCAVYDNGGEGYIYVAGFWNSRVQKFTLEGEFVSKWGTLGYENGEFRYPEGIATDKDGNVYVSDSGWNRVQKFDSNGNYITKWGTQGSGNGEFGRNAGIAVDKDGDVYVADQRNYRVQKFTSEGEYLTQWGIQGTGDGQFNSPRGIAVDKSGNVYVSDEGPGRSDDYPEGQPSRVQKFTSDGTFLKSWNLESNRSTGTPRLYGIAIDEEDSLFVVDTRNNKVNKFTSDGSLITQWGEWGAGDGQFSGPNGVAVDSGGYVYLVDSRNHRIQKFYTNSAPVANAGPDQNLIAGPDCTADVTLDGSGSTDSDSTPGTNDDIVSFEWYQGESFLGNGSTLVHTFPKGDHAVTLVVTDAFGETDEEMVSIKVQDATPPTVSLSLKKDTLRPPNHKMIDVGFSYELSDNCDALTAVSLEITSDEATSTAPAAGGVSNSPDAEITSGNQVLLRAERSGDGDGRVYVITLTPTDTSGNSLSSSIGVRVNYDKKTEAVDSGQAYDATQIN